MKALPIISAALLAATVIPAAADVSDGKVKIGILNDQSGVYADFGGKWSVEAAKMAVEDFGGKVQGAAIEIVDADHQNKPDIASNIARQWYDTEQVDAIMELTTSSVALAVQGISAEKKKIDIVTGAASSDLTGKACSPYGFHWAYDTHALAVGTGGALVGQGGDTWYFLTADYAFGYSLEEQTSNFVKSKGGTVVGAVRHPLATTDYSSFLLQAQSSGAKIVGGRAGLDTSNSITGRRFRHRGRWPALAALLYAGRGARPGRAAQGVADGLGTGTRTIRTALAGASSSAPTACPTWSRPAIFGRAAVPEGGRQGRHRQTRRCTSSCTRCR